MAHRSQRSLSDGFVHDPDRFGTMGINNLGQVVYAFTSDIQTDPVRPFIWLPEGDSQMGLAAGYHLFDALCGSPCDFDTPAIARAINDARIIVGQSGGMAAIDAAIGDPCDAAFGYATGWTISSGQLTSQLLGTLEDSGSPPAPPSGAWSGAFAINNDSNPVIVGDSSIQRPDSCSGSGDPARLYGGFRYTLNVSSSLIELNRASGHAVNSAYAVNDTPSQGNARIVGMSRCWDFWLGCTNGVYGNSCDFLMEPAKWDDGGSSAYIMDRLEDYGHIARGINNAGEIVGWGAIDVPCFITAPYWTSYSSMPPDDLGDYMPSGQSGDQSRAEDINNNSWVVGWNTLAETALLWTKTGSSWLVYDINDLIGNYASTWTIQHAHAINDSGWIAAVALQQIPNSSPIQCTVVLTPMTQCPFDVTKDGCVDDDDLEAVIAAWGACQPHFICHADVDRDGDVDDDDLEAVRLVHCEQPTLSCCGGCNNLAPLPEPDQSEFIQHVLNSGHSSATQSQIIQAILAW